MIDKNLLKLAKESLRKEAYVPMTPEALAAAQQPPPAPPGGDPNAGAGAPPMDPNAMPPVDPNTGAPMDPNAMPPVDPNTGAPMDPNAMPPTDPNAMPPQDPNAAPPQDPAAAGGQPIMLNLADLQALFKQVNDDGNDEADAQASAGQPESSPKRVTNKMLSEKIDQFSQTLDMIVQALGIQPPPQQTGPMPGAPSTAASPEDIQAALAQMPPGAAAQPKMAAVRSKDKLTKMIERLRAK
jgi:hypothetical protein